VGGELLGKRSLPRPLAYSPYPQENIEWVARGAEEMVMIGQLAFLLTMFFISMLFGGAYAIIGQQHLSLRMLLAALLP